MKRLWLGGLALLAAALALPLAAPYYNAAVRQGTVTPRVQAEALTSDRALGNTERFYDLAATFEVRVAQAADLGAQLAQATDADERARLSVEASGARTVCREVAAQYNADAQKTTRARLRDARLPERLDAARCTGGP